MAKLFNNTNQNVDKDSIAYAVQQYLSARSTLLAVIVFSLINFILLLTGSESYFLFSAVIPYYFALEMMIYFGMVAGIVVSVGIILAYFLCWLFSKKSKGWLIGATVLFGIDCLMLLYYISLSGEILPWALDILFHVLVFVSLINGLRYSKKYEEALNENGNVQIEDNSAEILETENNEVISENTENTEQ